MTWSDHVHAHGDLEELAPGLWQLTGSLPRVALKRNMAIWRVPGGLAIHSAVCADEAVMAEIEALGEPKVLIVPNRFHRADAPRFKERYPDIVVVSPRAARERVADVLPVEGVAEEVLPPLGTECLTPSGLKPAELIYRVPCDDGRHALVVCDCLFNHADVPGLMGWVFKRITRSTGPFGITGLGRWLMLQDSIAFAAFLRETAVEDLAAISVGHGDALVDDPAARLREAADRV